jgi:hypothetical protein
MNDKELMIGLNEQTIKRIELALIEKERLEKENTVLKYQLKELLRDCEICFKGFTGKDGYEKANYFFNKYFYESPPK